MAGIDLSSIKKIGKERNTLHDKVITTYSTFIYNGKKYIQFDMFGRPDRENPGKISQTLQLDEETAKFLISLLKETFNL